MMAYKRRKELQESQLRVKEVDIFHEKHLHNSVLQEYATQLEMMIRNGEDYIASSASVCFRLLWIQEGYSF